MGFFKNIFKKKKGGTLVGNLLRGVSSAATGGILGSGAGLAKWEAEQEQKEMERLYGKASLPAVSGGGVAYDGRQIGRNLVNGVVVPAAASNGGAGGSNIGENVILETLKKRWYYVLGGLIVFGGLIWYVARPKGAKFKRLK